MRASLSQHVVAGDASCPLQNHSLRMFRMLFLLMLGMGVGYFLHGSALVRHAAKGVRVTIPLLLFVFGASIGADGELIANIGFFGWQALVIALLGVVGSFVAAALFRRIFYGKGGAK